MRSTFIAAFVLLALNSVTHGFVCPTDGLFLNPDDQNTYFRCTSGIASLMPCLPGLVWDPINHVCNWPSDQAPQRFLIVVGGDRITGKCLDIADGSGAIHSEIQLFRCHGEENQQFELHHDGTLRSMGKCLDIPDSLAYDHQGVQLFYCRSGEENQRFFIDSDDHIHVMGKCFDVPNGEIVNNNLLQLFECRNQVDQRFRLIPV